jgi:hypothetical protein
MVRTVSNSLAVFFFAENPVLNQAEPDNHGFIIRIWRESRDPSHAEPEWRGSIEHVDDGRRMYFRELVKVLGFMHPYVHAMRMRRHWTERVAGWFKRT